MIGLRHTYNSGNKNGLSEANCCRQIKNDLSLVAIIAPHRREV